MRKAKTVAPNTLHVTRTTSTDSSNARRTSSNTTNVARGKSSVVRGRSSADALAVDEEESSSSDSSLLSSPFHPRTSHLKRGDDDDSFSSDSIECLGELDSPRAAPSSPIKKPNAECVENKRSSTEIANLKVGMKNKLLKNSSAANATSYDKDLLMTTLTNILCHRDTFLKAAHSIDSSNTGNLAVRVVMDTLPNKIPKKLLKKDLVYKLVDFWFIYCEISANSNDIRYSSKAKSAIGEFESILGRLERSTQAEIDEEAVSSTLLKSVTVSHNERQRRYKQQGGKSIAKRSLTFALNVVIIL